MIWAVFGTAVHSLFEKTNVAEYIHERRVKKKVGKITLSGQFDLYNSTTKRISDWKTASVWKYKKNDYEDWTKQFNIYAWLARQEGLMVNSLEAIALFKDWKKGESLRDSQYPPNAMVSIPITLMPNDEIEAYIMHRCKLHYDNISKTDDALTPCTTDEMWASKDIYAVREEGRKTAVYRYNQEDAEGLAKQMKNPVIEFKRGTRRRCEEYCPVNKFCSQYRDYCNSGKETAV